MKIINEIIKKTDNINYRQFILSHKIVESLLHKNRHTDLDNIYEMLNMIEAGYLVSDFAKNKDKSEIENITDYVNKTIDNLN